MKDEDIKKIKDFYPVGTRIKLISMQDDYAVPSGMVGTVIHVDDAGQIHMNWDNGRTLALVYGIDEFEKMNDYEKDRNNDNSGINAFNKNKNHIEMER